MKTLILHCLPRDFCARVITAITNIRHKPRETLRAFRERLLGLQSIATHLGVGFFVFKLSRGGLHDIISLMQIYLPLLIQ